MATKLEYEKVLAKCFDIIRRKVDELDKKDDLTEFDCNCLRQYMQACIILRRDDKAIDTKNSTVFAKMTNQELKDYLTKGSE